MSGPSSTVTVTNLLMGPAAIFYGAFGAVEPLDTSINIAPAASAWTDFGGTNGGVDLELGQEFKELEVDQVLDVVGTRMTKRVVTIKASLAEVTWANLQVIMNDSTPATAATYKTIEPIYTIAASNPTTRAIIFDGWAPGGTKTRRVIARKVVQVAKLGFSYKKDDQTLVDCEFKCHYVSTSIAPFKITDEV